MKEEGITIEIQAVLNYVNGKVYIRRLETNEMPATLTYELIEALNKAIVEHYKKDNA